MGRPLKIKKYSPGSGSGTYQQGTPVYLDIGFNNVGSLTNPVYPVTMTSSDFFGVVGGANAIGGITVASSQYPVVKTRVYITGSGGEDNGYIITQKGTTKYLVAAATPVADESLVVGSTYQILTVGTTNWTACGASKSNPAAGDIFVATAVGAGSGTARLVGVCALANEGSGAVTEGNMSITINIGDSTEVPISRLTNHYALDYSSPKNRYAVNWFTNDQTVIKSGTAGTTLELVQVNEYTS